MSASSLVGTFRTFVGTRLTVRQILWVGPRRLHDDGISHVGSGLLWGPCCICSRAAGPKLSRSSGGGRLRRTDFITDLSLGSGGSGSPGGLRPRFVGLPAPDPGNVPGWFRSTSSGPAWAPLLRAGGNCSFSSSLPTGSPSLVGRHAMRSFLAGVDLVAEVRD